MMKVLRRLSFVQLCVCIAAPLFAGFGSTETFLPAVGRLPGQNGAQFYTTVWATNLTSARQTFTFHFLKTGQANASPLSFDDALEPGQTKVYENVVETKLGLADALGAARITSSGEIFVSERIYNQAPGDDLGNTEGLFFAGVPKSFSISSGQSASIQGIDQGGSENFRYNFALIETSGSPATVDVQVFDGNGTLLGQKSYPLQPYEHLQPGVADIVQNIATTNARITATVTGGTGSVLLAGAQLANESQDSSGFEMTFRNSLLGSGGGNCTLCVTSLNGLTGALALTPGSGISITPSGQSISIAYTGGGGAGGITSVTHDASLSGAGTGASPLSIANGQVVRSVNGVHDAVTLAAGSNVTITPSGSTLTIASSGGGGGLTLPFVGSTSSAHPGFEVDSTASAAIVGNTTTTAAGVSGTGGYGVYGLGNATHATGVYGIDGNDGPSGDTGWAGVWGNSHDSTGVYGTSFNDRGVLGITHSASAAAAVEGLNTAGNGVGILGRTGTGSGSSLSGYDGGAGVWGDAGSDIAVGVLGTGTYAGVQGFAYRAGGAGVYYTGGLAGTGTKSFVEPHPTDPGKQLRYVCLEGPESGTYFRGTGRIVGGFATIDVPEDFRLVSRPDGLTVQLTPVGDLAVLAVMSQDLDRVVVRGSTDVEFHYMVNGVRRNVPMLEPIEENRFFVPRSPNDRALAKFSDPETRALLVRNGILNEDGTINLETARRLGWDQQESWKRAEAGNKDH